MVGGAAAAGATTSAVATRKRAIVWRCAAMFWHAEMPWLGCRQCAQEWVLAGCAVADVALEEFAEVSAVGGDFVLEDGKGRVLEGVVFGDCGVGGVCVRVAA